MEKIHELVDKIRNEQVLNINIPVLQINNLTIYLDEKPETLQY